MVAQTIHAAGESSPGNLPQNTHAVALAARDETHLLELEGTLLAAGIPHHSIREPDAPYLGAIMSIGIPPMDRTPLRRYLSGLPLVR